MFEIERRDRIVMAGGAECNRVQMMFGERLKQHRQDREHYGPSASSACRSSIVQQEHIAGGEPPD